MKLKTPTRFARVLVATLLVAVVPTLADLRLAVSGCDGLEGEEFKRCITGEDSSSTIGGNSIQALASIDVFHTQSWNDRLTRFAYARRLSLTYSDVEANERKES